MVIGATGHQDLPASGTNEIRAQIREELARVSNLVGVCSLAAGADQLFAKLVLDAGGQLRVVVPSRKYETTFSEASNRDAYDELLARATSVERLDFDEPSEAAFFAAGGRVVDTCARLLAIWDGEPARGFGGTADVVRYARAQGTEVVVIWPEGLKR